ncbi:ubiquinone biosynthesis protein UbiB, partial [Candidatus Pelagibacter sp.]|nr:ubiquinone biosynthesis protein UbiB [Candidatus Pelagibacter sp.]
MKVCILGSGLTALTLAKALVNQNIFVDMVSDVLNYKINQSRTIGISKSNFEYLNKNVINIKKIAWKLKKIEIYSDNLKKE